MFHRVKSESPSSSASTDKKESTAHVSESSYLSKARSAESKSIASSADADNSAASKSAAPSYGSKASSHSVSPVQKSQSYLQVNNTPEKAKEEDVKTMSESNREKAMPKAVDASTAPASPYQRAPAGVTGYSPSYTSPYSSPAASSSTMSTDAAAVGDRKLTIGRGITMSGEIESCDHLYVEGTVEAALKGAEMLEVAESGVFYGTVEIQNATIAGRFEGEIAVQGRLVVESTGVITGSISYGELEVESGAVIDGRMTPFAAPAAKAAAGSKSSASAEKSESAASGLFQENMTAAE